MNILGFLKWIKAPSFEEEFIQEPAERLIEGGKAGKTGLLPTRLEEETWEEWSARVRQEWDKAPLNPANPGGVDYDHYLWDDK